VSYGGADWGGPAPAQTACGQGGSTGIAGTIDGVQIHEAWEPVSGIWQNRITHWSLDSQFAGNAFEYFLGGDAQQLDPPGSGQPVHLGVVRAPASSALAGQVLCFGDGGANFSDKLSYHGYSNHARVLGQCPGVPVEGELTLCGSDFNAECAAPISGTLEGTPLQANNLQLGMRDSALLDGESDSLKLYGYVEGYVEPEPRSSNAGEITEGFLIIYPNTPGFAPAVYCLGPGSTFDAFSKGNYIEASLRNLSKLGECPNNAGDDAVQLCN